MCSESHFLNLDTNTCELCNLPCKTCGSDADDCLSCLDGMWWLNGATCSLCNSPCETCGSSADDCKSCISGMILNGNVCGDTSACTMYI